MKHLVPPAAVLLAAFSFLASPGSAFQTRVIRPEHGQGLFSSWPVGLTVRNAADPLLVRATGAASGVPTVWSAATFGAAGNDHPDYSMTALIASWGLPSNTRAPSFGGISTGGEVMPEVNANGELIFLPDDWYALTVSVAGNSTALSGSMVEVLREGQTPRNPGGDLFTYYAIGSDRIHEDYVDSVRLEQSREQLQLAQVAISPAGEREVSNFDYGMGVISVNPNNPTAPMFPVRDKFYFTLTKAWVDYMASNHPQFQVAGAQPSASTVYQMTWTATSTPPWSAPTVAFTHAELFGQVAVPSLIEIDALSVYVSTAGSRVVFSLTPASDGALSTGFFDQILVYQDDGTTPFTTTSLKTHPPGGPVTTFSSHLGLRTRSEGEPTNVTAVCAIDPDEPYQIGTYVGIATNQLACREGRLGLSAFRRCPATSHHQDDEVHLRITGLELDFDAYDLGAVQVLAEGPALPPDDPGEPEEPTPGAGPFWIDSAAAGGNTIDLVIPVPHTPGGTTFRCSAQYWGISFSSYPPAVLQRESAVISIKY